MSASKELKIVANATCTFCGCGCDGMELTVEGDHITKATNACVLGKAWSLNHYVEDRPIAAIHGKPATLEEAVERAAQIVASDPMANFSQPAREHLARIPYIALDPKETPTVKAAVAFTTATYGINTAGTVYRMDGVPIPLRPVFASPYPSDGEVLKRIEKRVREIQRAKG